jgi:hypothetical protein
MSKDDRDRAEARINKITRAAQDAKTGKTERDASAKAVLDNMARLKALRLAREAAAPQPAPVASRKARAKPVKSGEKAATLSAWLESQQNSGRRT